MTGRIAHRGPDDSGTWIDPALGLAMGFRRLAVRDLTPAGAQPMVSASGQTRIVLNGEIYNVAELRTALEKSGCRVALRGNSDTEVLVEAIDAWGLETALKKAVGMFALAVWDQRQRSLLLARDRFGEKPLYYGVHHGVLLFGSELKALREHSAMVTDIDRDALAGLARHGYVPGPRTIYQGTSKLPPGTVLALRDRDIHFNRIPAPRPYWNLVEVAQRGVQQEFSGSEDDACRELLTLLSRTIREQMVSDVPLGAFLSGGIDSSLIVALMQSESVRPIRTFTIGFDQPEFNEAPSAAAVARHLRTDHTELYVTSDQALNVIPRLPEIYDEPFADASQIPTFLVSELARKHVTVALSGDGADEIFGGYARYPASVSLWRTFGWMPRWIRSAGAAALQNLPGSAAAPSGSWLRKLHLASQVLGAPGFDECYRLLVSSWRKPSEVMRSAIVDPNPGRPLPGELSDRFRRMMLIDAMTYLPDDILTKVDRATMAVSLESRAPFLDHRIAEFAARLPTSMLLHKGQGKRLLRKLLQRYVPQALFDRPKMGFRVPLGEWLRGPLRGWAEELLSRRMLVDDAYWNAERVRATWVMHASGQRDAAPQLWPILMFQSWLAAQKTASSLRHAA